MASFFQRLRSRSSEARVAKKRILNMEESFGVVGFERALKGGGTLDGERVCGFWCDKRLENGMG